MSKEAGRFNNWDDIVVDENIDNWGSTLARSLWTWKTNKQTTTTKLGSVINKCKQ